MNQARRDEFLAIIKRVWGIPRPRVDYSMLSNATLTGVEFLRRLMEIQAGVMLIFRSTGKLPATKNGLNLILRRSMEIAPAGLAEDFEACGEREIVALIADLKLEELFIGAELQRRLADKRIGTVLILAPFFTGALPTERWLTKELKVDRIKAYRPHEQEKHDIQYSSLTRAFELAHNLEY